MHFARSMLEVPRIAVTGRYRARDVKALLLRDQLRRACSFPPLLFRPIELRVRRRQLLDDVLQLRFQHRDLLLIGGDAPGRPLETYERCRCVWASSRDLRDLLLVVLEPIGVRAPRDRRCAITAAREGCLPVAESPRLFAEPGYCPDSSVIFSRLVREAHPERVSPGENVAA